MTVTSEQHAAEWGTIPSYDPVATAGDCWFDDAAAQRACDFFRGCLTFTAGEKAGEPFILEDWQQAIVANLFGWKRQDGTRRYRQAMIYIPRGCGKTEMAAGVGNYLGFVDGEKAPHVYIAASDADQARLAFNAASVMIRAEPELSKRCKIYGGQSAPKSIWIPDTNGFIKILSAEAYSKHGLNAHGVIIDELHAQPNRDLVDVLVTSTGKRHQPLIVYITTADVIRESICNEVYDKAKAVIKGRVADPYFLPVIYEALPEDDWTDPDVWAKANPNLGVSVNATYIREMAEHATQTPAFENTFKRLHLNIRTQQDVRWIPLELWDANAGADGWLELREAMAGRECWGGLDLSAVQDMTAFVLVFPGPPHVILPWFWLPASCMTNPKHYQNRESYHQWQTQGCLTVQPGDVIDYGSVRHDIIQIVEDYGLREIRYDRQFQGEGVRQQLEVEDGIQMAAFGQGYMSMAAPTSEFERLVLGHQFRHGGHPVLRWQAGNVAVEIDSDGNKKPSKKLSHQKIDGIVAAIMALSGAVLDAGEASVYDSEEWLAGDRI